MDFTTPENLPFEETLWTVCVFDFVVSRTPGCEWLYVVPSRRGLHGELAYLAAGGKPLPRSGSIKRLVRTRAQGLLL